MLSSDKLHYYKIQFGKMAFTKWSRSGIWHETTEKRIKKPSYVFICNLQ